MNVIVVGCGRVGAELAFSLYQKGHSVTVIDNKRSNFDNLHVNFRGRTIEGEVLNEDVLIRAGIEKADGLAAVTTSDALNAVIGHVARKAFNISNVVVRNYDPSRISLIEAFGLQIVASSSWGAQRIEELLHHAEMHTVFSAGNGEVEIYEFSIKEPWAGRTLQEILPDETVLPVALTRAGQAVLPSGDLTLLESDILLVSSTFTGIEALRKRLAQPQEA